MKWLRLLVWSMLAAASGAQAQIAFRAAAQASVAVGGTGGITFIGASASAASRNNCGNINPAIPGGNVDDVLIALVNARENGATVTMTGWNEAYSDVFPGVGPEMQVKVYWRLATGTDPNTVTQSGTCSSIGAQIARFRGVDTAQPLETDPIPAQIRTYSGGAGGCPAGTHYMGIRPNGDVTPCPYLPVFAGTLRNSSLADLWTSSELFTGIRRRTSLGASGARYRRRPFGKARSGRR